MFRFARILAAAVSLLSVTAAVSHAKDVCLQWGGDRFVFRKVKKLRPGGAIPLQGLLVSGIQQIPVIGVATMYTNGVVQVGAHTFNLQFGGPILAVGWIGDSTLAGTGFYEVEDDTPNSTPDGSVAVTVIECDTVTIP